MEIILLERVEKLGNLGDVVKVKPGFARNYLLPQKKALRASKSNLEVFAKRRAEIEAANQRRREAAEGKAGSIEGLTVVIIRQAGESGQLYGSVTARDVAEAARAAGQEVERSQVEITTTIKTLGLFPVRVVLHPEVVRQITVNVARSAEEAELQRQRGGMVVSNLDADDDEAADEAPAAEATEGEDAAA
ncbi:MAG TPA: 50S ribosomal protein L9 [Alphaproteobacteria bacterium]|nr:50S ribosomal protein L9 [Alphaproteobacteria bacterium]